MKENNISKISTHCALQEPDVSDAAYGSRQEPGIPDTTYNSRQESGIPDTVYNFRQESGIPNIAYNPLQESSIPDTSYSFQQKPDIPDTARNSRPEPNIPDSAHGFRPAPGIPDAAHGSRPKPDILHSAHGSRPAPDILDAAHGSRPEPDILDAAHNPRPEPDILDAARNSQPEPDILDAAHGPVTIPMTNDYLFRAMLQKNNKVLQGLLCSLLHLSPSQLHSAVITNPIDLGSAIDSKTLLLDVRLILNDSTIVNLEMQVINEHNWPERSLTYLCRSFDHLNPGEDYISAKPAIQIGLLAFTLFPEHPEFYSTYRFLNIKTYAEYSDKLTLSVLDLTQIDLATEEDRAYHMDYWASLFRAATWEEIKMLAQKDEFIKEASGTIYQLSQEENIRLQCEAREDYYRRQRDAEHRMAAKDSIIAEQKSALAEQQSVIAEQQSAIAEQKSIIAEKDSAIKALQAEIELLKNSRSAP